MENDQDLFPDGLPFEFNKPESNDSLREKSRQELLRNIAVYTPRNRWRSLKLWGPVVTGCVLLFGVLLMFNRKRKSCRNKQS